MNAITMHRRTANVTAAVLSSALFAGCANFQQLVPTGAASQSVSNNAPSASRLSYLYAIPDNGKDEVLWGRYPYRGNVLPRRIVHGIVGPGALAAAPSGEVFVANDGNDTVTGYASPRYTGKSPGTLLHTIPTYLPTHHAARPIAMVVDASNDLFVLLPYNVVNLYKPPRYKEARSFTFPGIVDSILAAPNGDLLVASLGQPWRLVAPHYHVQLLYEPTSGYTTPLALALDPKQNLFIADGTAHLIYIYAHRHYLKGPVADFPDGSCCQQHVGIRLGDQQLLISSSSYVYLMLRGKKIAEYAPPDYTHITVIDKGSKPRVALINSDGNLVVANGAGGIELFKLPAGTPLKTISPGTTFEAIINVP